MYYLTPLCCVCSESSKNLHNLNHKDNQQLMQQFQYCTYGIDDVEPSIPLCMCNNCLHNLNVAYEFKKSCATNIARLRSYATQLTVPRDEKDFIVYSDIQVNIARCSPTSNLSFKGFEPTICVVKSIKTEDDPFLGESLNINDEHLLFETYSAMDAKESIENLSCLSEIIKQEHNYTKIDYENQPIKDEVLADEENYLNHSVKEISIMQASPVNVPPTSASLQSTEEIHVRRSELENASNKLLRNAKSEMITKSSVIKEELLDVDRDVALAANGGDSPRGRRTPRTKRQVSPRRSAKFNKVLKKKSDLLYKCNICERRFSGIVYLRTHLQSHCDRSYRCTECGKTFSRKKNLQRHIEIHSRNRKKYKCTLCPKQYSNNNNLIAHFTKTHQTKCTKCNKVFKSNEELRLHRANEHFKEFYFECEICGKVLTRLYSYQDHMRSHESGTPFQCTHCPEEFQSNHCLKQHMALKHNIGKLRCQNCGINLEKSMYDEHMKTHETDSRHECPECGKTYKREREFKVHVKKHNVENCYKCNQCGKMYLKSRMYKNHMLTHSVT